MCPDQPRASSDFIAGLLAELDPDARLVDFALVDRNYYTLRIDLPGEEVGKSFTVPCRIVEKAFTDPRGLTVLRNILQSVVTTIRAQRTIQASRDAPSGTTPSPSAPHAHGASRPATR